ncbi:unnamed protein product [Aphanomyces euteiches]|uniref:Actin n=1 Tax=Aphanomyces euteiches TaxID=100861 RepID=A0A6G0WTC3_9STRA|nr:hypothetical protein Ae201684_012096 [Aphanomyces euteiches]KAH9056218.1 hypothetical protein Ae201684P_021955 [Aphanomyces euteiches]KAH9139297.1 hypothetical protein AeRB84_016429 [Aphanomyces euteiches]
MYSGGDELNAIVCDVGCLRSRMGFAGEDDARYIGSPASSDADMNGIKTADGAIASWTRLEEMLDAGYDRLGVASSSHHPILWSESSLQSIPVDDEPTKSDREAIAEIFFEKYNVPAYFVSKSAVLTCFANGRSTGLVMELGHGSTAAVPVHEGYVLASHAVRQTTMGGHSLDAFLHQRVVDKLQTTNVSVSWPTIRDMKETVCRASETLFDEKANSQIPQMPYELPDGTQVSLGVERFSVAEHYFHYDAKASETSVFLPSMVLDAASRGDADSKKEFLHNIVLTGGSSCFENLQTRLERELTTLAPSAKIKVVAAPPSERKLGAFLGGSILASLGSFHEMWISKTEYNEYGASLVQKKCP